MGDKITKVKEALLTPKFTPVQFLIGIISIIAFVFMNTGLFDKQDDLIKVIFYAAVMILGIIFGGKLIGMGKKVVDIINILKDSTKTAVEKIQIITPIAIQILTALGFQYDLLNIEQDTKPSDQVVVPEPVAPKEPVT